MPLLGCFQKKDCRVSGLLFGPPLLLTLIGSYRGLEFRLSHTIPCGEAPGAQLQYVTLALN